jgi:serpin B
MFILVYQGDQDMLKKIIPLIFYALFFHPGCSRDMSPIISEKPQLMRPLTAGEQTIVNSAADFGLDLFKEIAVSAATDENIFISPLSVSMALGMTMNGADSSTYTEMQQTLRFEGLSGEEINKGYKSLMALMMQADAKVIFEIANSIWYRNQFTFNPVFIETNRKDFDAC